MKVFLGLGTFLFACGLLPSAAFAIVSIDNSTSCDISELTDIQGSVKLPPQCTYKGGIVISSSNVTLNCQGATFDGEGKTNYGLLIKSKNRGIRISNVTIENCKFINYADTAIRIVGIPKSEFVADIQDNYKRSTTNVVIRHVVTENSRRSGIYFAGFVSNSSLQHSTIKNSGGPGIYLDQTTAIDIQGNRIESNGRVEGRKAEREGLAIDAAAKTIIRSNTFIGNAAGSIFLYKNCGEFIHRPTGVIRWQASNDNVIENNKFIDEKVSVWLASRQSKNLINSDCGDRPLDAEKKYFEDYADYNVVAGNVFCGVNVAVRNEGNNNRVENNKYDGKTKRMVEEPYQKKPKHSGEFSTGNTSTHNTRAACDTN